MKAGNLYEIIYWLFLLLFFFSSGFPVGFSSVLLSGLMIPFTVSPIGSLSSTPRLGATVFTSELRKVACTSVSSVEYGDIA